MVQLIKSRLTEGTWHGEVTGVDVTPTVVATFLNDKVEGVEVFEVEGGNWGITVPVPAAMMSDGVHTCLVSLDDETELARFSVIAGEPLADDLRGEIGLLRAELDLLKKAFRRHCVETMG